MTDLLIGGCVKIESSEEPFILPADDLTGSGNTVNVTYAVVSDSNFKTEADVKNLFLNVFTESYLKETYYYLFQDTQKEYCIANAVDGYVPDKVKSVYVDNDKGKLCIEQEMAVSGEVYIQWDMDTISEVRQNDNQISFLIDGTTIGGSSAETIPGNFLLENTDNGWRIAGYSAAYYNTGNIFLS
jgi:hypothetical protein